MGIGKFFLEKLAEMYGLKEALTRFRASFALGESSKIPVPREIAQGSIDFVSHGLLNMFAIQCNLDWVLPYWVNRQYDESSNSYVPGTVLSTNLTHRNWTAIGALDSTREPIVDPAGLVTPWFDGWSADFWVSKAGYLIVPSRNDEVYQYLVRQLPIVVSQFVKKDVRLISTSFAYKYRDEEIVSMTLSVENLESIEVNLSVFVNVRPYNPEGISVIREILYDRNRLCFDVNGGAGLFLSEPPDRIYCSRHEQGDSSFEAQSVRASESSQCTRGLATAFAEYKLSLASGEVKEIEARAITTSKKPERVDKRIVYGIPRQEMKRNLITEWDERLAGKLSIRIPYQKLQNAFNANKAHLYLFYDGEEITPGPFLYHHGYFRDAAYMVTALDKVGFHAEAERILLGYPAKQDGSGYFISQEGEWDSNGEAIWTFYQHYLYTRSAGFLETIFDSAYRGFKWIRKMREKKTGLLPAGYSAEHFGPNDNFYWDNFWSLAGLAGLAFMASELGAEREREEVQAELDDYSRTVFTSIDRDAARFPYPLIPSSPHRSVDSSLIGAIAALYPLRLVDPRDPRMTGTLRMIRRKYQANHAFLHRVIHSGYNVYLTAQLAECYLFRRSSRVLPILQWIMNNISRTGTFPEAIHPVTGGGCMGDGHHGWACADLIHLIRNIFFFEDGERIVITPVVFHRWMEAGETMEVRNAPSYFGKIGFSIDPKADRIILTLDNSYTVAPVSVEFSIPFFIQKAFVDGKRADVTKANSVVFPPHAKEVVVYR